jgi:hypothetical protein
LASFARQGLETDTGDEAATAAAERFQEVDLSTLDLVRPRRVGVEHAALSALRQLGFEDKLAELGFNRPQIAASVGNVVGRIAAPASELATYDWLRQRTALGELIGYDYEAMGLQQLYRSADALLKHRDALETHLFETAQSLFSLTETITLYDLTNTYPRVNPPLACSVARGHVLKAWPAALQKPNVAARRKSVATVPW